MKPKSEFSGNDFLYILLALGGGVFGAHSFYAGRNIRGTLQLLLTVLSCGLFLPLTIVWVLLDIVLFHPGKNTGLKISAAALLLCALAGLTLLVLGTYYLYGSALEEDCRNNFWLINAALQEYAEKNNNCYPEGDNDAGLLELEGLDSENLICPVTEERTYIYLGGANTTESECPVLFELPGKHGDTIHVLYTNSCVLEIDAEGAETAYDVLILLEKMAQTESVKNFLRKKLEIFRQ